MSEEEKRLSKVDPDALENGTTTDSTPAVVTSVTPLIEGNKGETSVPMMSFLIRANHQYYQYIAYCIVSCLTYSHSVLVISSLYSNI